MGLADVFQVGLMSTVSFASLPVRLPVTFKVLNVEPARVAICIRYDVVVPLVLAVVSPIVNPTRLFVVSVQFHTMGLSPFASVLDAVADVRDDKGNDVVGTPIALNVFVGSHTDKLLAGLPVADLKYNVPTVHVPGAAPVPVGTIILVADPKLNSDPLAPVMPPDDIWLYAIPVHNTKPTSIVLIAGYTPPIHHPPPPTQDSRIQPD